MAFPSVSRGRGRARMLANALPKPGTEPKTNKYSSLGIPATVSVVNGVESSLTTCLKNPTTANIESFRQKAEGFLNNSEENITTLVDLICTQCFADTDLATVSGEIVSVLATMSDSGWKLRGTLLKKVQKAYKNREEESKKDFDNYLGFSTLFCSLFKWLRVNGEPLTALTAPVYQVLGDLLDGRSDTPAQREQEIETFHNCVLMVGEVLEKIDRNKMSELFKKVRQNILKKASPKMRCLLMETLEYHASGNWTGNNDIKLYYSDLLSDIMAKA